MRLSIRENWQEKVYKTQHTEDFLTTREWKLLRAEVFIRDNFRCYRCEKRYGRVHLTAHHIIPREMGGPNDISNLITLCNDCHDIVEIAGCTSLVEIAATIEGDIKTRKEKPVKDREESFERPGWHQYVYGGMKRK